MNLEDIRPPVKVLEWLGGEQGFLRLLDQTALPNETLYVDCRDTATLHQAIKRLVVRGAPAIGVAAGYGMALAAQQIVDGPGFIDGLQEQAAYLESARPTAVNLAWAVRRVMRRAQESQGSPVRFDRELTAERKHGDVVPLQESPVRTQAVPPPSGGDFLETHSSASANALRAIILDEARKIHAEDERMCLAIGRHASELIMRCRGVLTHCNAGALATAGIGTATAGFYVAHAGGHRFTVYCDETRPLLQGARLTAWELMQGGLDAVLITDNMAAQVMREGKVQMVIVGADRIAANGDTANKIGTYGVAILAHRHGIPFYVAAPYSTFDLNIRSGQDIPIELRSSEEITEGFGRRTAPDGIKTYSPAFDVTPAELVKGIVTERGIISPVNEQAIRAMMDATTKA